VQRLPAHDLGDIDEQHDDGEYRSHGTHITDDGGKRTLQLVTVRSIAFDGTDYHVPKIRSQSFLQFSCDLKRKLIVLK